VAAGTRRRLSAFERRETILAAAMAVFAERGYHGASVDDVAHAAGVSKALIYEHFPSKKDLHESLVEREVADLFARLEANAASGSHGADRMQGGIDAFLGFVEERRTAWRMLFRDAADAEVAEVLDRVEAQAVGLIVALSADEAGDRPAEDREVYARMLSGALQALANWWLDHPDVPRERLVARVMEFAWIGLREASEPPR
jgi:AcrR family transcriptional regulator